MNENNSTNFKKTDLKIRTMKDDIAELSKRTLPKPDLIQKNVPIPKPPLAKIEIPQKPPEKFQNLSVKPPIIPEIEKPEQEKIKKSAVIEIPIEKLPVEKNIKPSLEPKTLELPIIKPPKAIPILEAPKEKPIIPPELPSKIKKVIKILLIVLPIIIIVGTGIGFSFYYFSSPASFPEPKAPQALFVVDKIKIINLDAEDPIILIEKIKEVSAKKDDPGVFSQLLIKKTETICFKFRKNCVKKSSYLSLAEIYKLLKITSPNFMQNLDSNRATIFVYQDGANVKFGIVAEPENSISAQNEILGLENNLYDRLPPFIRPAELNPAYETFQSISYKNIQIRRNDYPTPDQSISHAFFTPNSYILIAGSQNSMTAIIDRLSETLSR